MLPMDWPDELVLEEPAAPKALATSPPASEDAVPELSPTVGVASLAAEVTIGLVSSAVAEETGTPVFGRLCCFCVSLSDGERERLRFESGSGMAGVLAYTDWCGFSKWGMRSESAEVGCGLRRGMF